MVCDRLSDSFPISPLRQICDNKSSLVLCYQYNTAVNFISNPFLPIQLLRKDRSRVKPSDHSRLNGSLPSSRTGTLVKCATIAAPTCYTASGLTLSRSENSTASNTAIEAETDTQNLDAFIQWFRRLAMFVASEICKVG